MTAPEASANGHGLAQAFRGANGSRVRPRSWLDRPPLSMGDRGAGIDGGGSAKTHTTNRAACGSRRVAKLLARDGGLSACVRSEFESIRRRNSEDYAVIVNGSQTYIGPIASITSELRPRRVRVSRRKKYSPLEIALVPTVILNLPYSPFLSYLITSPSTDSSSVSTFSEFISNTSS